MSVAGSATFTAHVSRPGFTPAGEHVAVSCAARPEPRARRRANPARSPNQLLPLLGLCPSTVAVSVAIQHTHSCVSRDSHTSPLHSHWETWLHVRACPPSSPLHIATSHMLFLSHSAAHSLVPFPSHTHHTTHTRGGTHPRCFTHTPCLTPTWLFAHTCRFPRTRSLFH